MILPGTAPRLAGGPAGDTTPRPGDTSARGITPRPDLQRHQPPHARRHRTGLRHQAPRPRPPRRRAVPTQPQSLHPTGTVSCSSHRRVPSRQWGVRTAPFAWMDTGQSSRMHGHQRLRICFVVQKFGTDQDRPGTAETADMRRDQRDHLRDGDVSVPERKPPDIGSPSGQDPFQPDPRRHRAVVMELHDGPIHQFVVVRRVEVGTENPPAQPNLRVEYHVLGKSGDHPEITGRLSQNRSHRCSCLVDRPHHPITTRLPEQGRHRRRQARRHRQPDPLRHIDLGTQAFDKARSTPPDRRTDEQRDRGMPALAHARSSIECRSHPDTAHL